MSVVSKIVFLGLMFRSSLEFSLTRPTSDRSYLSFLKYKLLNISSAISMKELHLVSKLYKYHLRASTLLVFLSIFKLSKIYGPLFIGSIFTIFISFSSLSNNFF